MALPKLRHKLLKKRWRDIKIGKRTFGMKTNISRLQFIQSSLPILTSPQSRLFLVIFPRQRHQPPSQSIGSLFHPARSILVPMGCRSAYTGLQRCFFGAAQCFKTKWECLSKNAWAPQRSVVTSSWHLPGPSVALALWPLMKVLGLWSCKGSIRSSQTMFCEIFQRGSSDTRAGVTGHTLDLTSLVWYKVVW